MKTVSEIWNEYARVLPINASPTQVRETKRAFLSGMYALDTAMNEVAGLPDGEDVRALETIKSDLMGELLKLIREDWPGAVS